MLRDIQTINDAAVDAKLYPANYVADDGNRATRFRAVVDQFGRAQCMVTKSFTLATNPRLVDAFDLALSEVSLEVALRQASYEPRSGKFLLWVDVPTLAWREPGTRGSEMKPGLVLMNSYGANSSIRGLDAELAAICSNGQFIGEIESIMLQRHVGEIDLMSFCRRLVSGIKDRVEVERLVADTMYRTRYPLWRVPSKEEVAEMEPKDRRLLDRIVHAVPGRYENNFVVNVRDNRALIGDNLWALEQAVTELATHSMRGQSARDFASVYGAQIRKAAKQEAAIA